MSDQEPVVNRINVNPVLRTAREQIEMLRRAIPAIDLNDPRTSRLKAVFLLLEYHLEELATQDERMPLLLRQIDDLEDELIVEETEQDPIVLEGLWSRTDPMPYHEARAELLRLGRIPQDHCLLCARAGHQRCLRMLCGLHHDESLECLECRADDREV